MAVAINILIITFTIEHFQHLAIALSTSCTMLLNFLFLGVVLNRKLDGFSLKKMFIGVVKIVTATVALLLLLLFIQPFFEIALNGNKFYQTISVLFLIGLAAFVYGLTLYLLKFQEITLLLDTLRRKFSKNK